MEIGTMERGNVLVIGNSGVGKSTLINAVLGEDVATTGWGIEGTTKELKTYESAKIPFRLIDSVGFEPSLFKSNQAIGAVKKWSQDAAKKGHEDNKINVIWFCVEGTTSKLFPQTIKSLSRAVSFWKSVPIIVVITKSYSVPDRVKNVDMVKRAFSTIKNNNLRAIIPVVAATSVLNEDAYAPPEGIEELIKNTNELMPEGLHAADADLASFILNRKKILSQGVVSIATATGATIGAVPVPFPDALILSPTEVAEINAVSYIYGINKKDGYKKFLESIIDVGAVSAGAKLALNSLKAIPGIRLGASVVNAVVAGSIVAVIGEVSIYAFEQIYLGNKTLDDIDWIKKITEARLSQSFVERINQVADNINSDSIDFASIANTIVKVFFKNH